MCILLNDKLHLLHILYCIFLKYNVLQFNCFDFIEKFFSLPTPILN